MSRLNILKTQNVKQLIFCLLTFFVFGYCQAQTIKLNKAIDVDTLHIRLSYCDLLDSAIRKGLEESAGKAIVRFNEKKLGFTATLDSSNSTTSLHLLVGEIDYVTKKDNLIWTGIGLATLVGHVYVISAIGWTLPILLIPSSVSKVILEPSEGLFSNHKRHNKIFFNPSGFYRSIEKQKEKTIENSEGVIYRFLKNLGKQDQRNH